MNGTVILIGAGPGDAGLLTCRGRELLAKAQVVVYDRLVGPEILNLIPADAERIDVGKESGSHPVPQTQISQLLVDRARAGKLVVRLKGGDPFLFGRGGEELALLAAHGIDFQVVPGVTSAIAVPAYAGIPVTHRDHSSSLHIITGHAKAGAELTIDFEALVRTGGTLVFLMGVASLPQICRGLLDAGMAPDTPAAVIEQGTLPQQAVFSSTLDRLCEDAAAAKSPAVIVVGSVCSLADRLAWFAPQAEKTVVVTRPADRSGSLCGRLRKLGMTVLDYPCIQTVPIDPNPALDAALAHLEHYRWLVFTSPAAPKVFFDRLLASGRDARALGRIQLAAIGPKTAEALTPYGLRADLVPETYDSDHLADAMADVDGPVLLCRASQGSAALPKCFTAKGIPYLDLAVYDTVYEAPDPLPILQQLDKPLLVTFTSASTVRGFAGSLPGADLSNVLACCIGPKTAAEAKKYGLRTITAREATMDSLIELIKEV